MSVASSSSCFDSSRLRKAANSWRQRAGSNGTRTKSFISRASVRLRSEVAIEHLLEDHVQDHDPPVRFAPEDDAQAVGRPEQVKRLGDLKLHDLLRPRLRG